MLWVADVVVPLFMLAELLRFASVHPTEAITKLDAMARAANFFLSLISKFDFSILFFLFL